MASDQNNTRKLRVLCLDIEGGHGGSSRSLLMTIGALDRDHVDPHVICRRGGAIEAAYSDMGVQCGVAPSIPKLTALERTSRNIVEHALFWTKQWPAAGAFRNELVERLQSFDVLHCNHVSLSPLASWLKRRLPHLAITMHIRTRPTLSFFARHQTRTAADACDGFVFITENEKETFERLLGRKTDGHVVYNAVSPPTLPREGLPEPGEEELRVLALSNYSFNRGTDRVVDIALALPASEQGRIRFVVAGDMSLQGSLPDLLGDVADSGGTLEDYAKARSASNSIDFLGHVTNPEDLLKSCHVLLKPTREANPWGRDILEGLAYGLPVASVGTYNRFVETGVTGLLQKTFDASEVAQWLVTLRQDKAKRRSLGDAAARRIATLCDPGECASEILDLWTRAAAAKPRRD